MEGQAVARGARNLYFPNHPPPTIYFGIQPFKQPKSSHDGSQDIRVSSDGLKKTLTDIRAELVLLDTSVVMPCSIS